jgi:glyoxylase-like metal-dependent hydrolase (beta-lactamase superfamily II)
MTVKSLQVLFLGQDAGIARSRLAYGTEEGKLITTPFLGFLIRTDSQNILFDAGMHPDNAAHLRSQGRDMTVREEDHLPARLKEVAGLTMADIDLIILSHVHRDHTGWLGHFPKAEVIVQKEDYTAAVIEPAPYYNPIYPLKKYTERDIQWKLISGDQILMPGLTVLLTPGHTRGHQVLMVDLPQSGTIMLTGDAFLDLECLEKEIIPGIYADRGEALNSMRKIKVMAKLRNAKVFPSHDMECYRQQIKKPPEAYT